MRQRDEVPVDVGGRCGHQVERDRGREERGEREREGGRHKK